jgi:hypothetical protein
MSVSTSVRIPDEVYSRLKHASKMRGKPVNRLIIEAVDRQYRELPPDGMRADIGLADIIGMVSSEGCYDARKSEDEFGTYLEKKHREGHL